jgi:hypothetical protein
MAETKTLWPLAMYKIGNANAIDAVIEPHVDGAARTRVEFEHRKLDRYGDRRDELRTIFDKTGDWGRLLAGFAEAAATMAGIRK